MMVTASKPVFYSATETDRELVGVVGHDIVLSEFTQLVADFESGKSYAFLIDKVTLFLFA